jgi:hypothetical protein
MKNILFVLIALSLFSVGCNKSDKANIEGVWQEKSITSKFGGTKYWIKFSSDHSFEMKLNHFTDAIEVDPVPCSGNRTDYVKGNYTISGKEIMFNGSYCDATFNQVQANCQGTATFQTGFTYTFIDGDLVMDFDKEDQYKVWLQKQ